MTNPRREYISEDETMKHMDNCFGEMILEDMDSEFQFADADFMQW